MDIEKITEDFEKFLLEFDEQKLDEWIKFDKRRTLLSKLQQYAVSNSVCHAGQRYSDCHIHSDNIGGCLECVNFRQTDC